MTVYRFPGDRYLREVVKGQFLPISVATAHLVKKAMAEKSLRIVEITKELQAQVIGWEAAS